ncbi:hypothetical protein DUNSADRAFT_12107 [Dunaliella salina]|uniref:Uncharacterized protein n=1 Tax=Dunaliella salina TaxID=3046 RepID=A0ABQ7H4A1_DUNSA|nr:hypothetical protein DUNSADRAFT_12107 [Dunaliella salina]|eukprot:KAF5841651.1 hypothetical protein DUNSADRAFT_12107 [Dunaliella salina]
MAEPGAWRQLADNLRNLENLSLTLPSLEAPPSSSTFVHLLHEIAGVTSLQHFKFSVHSQGLCFTERDLTPLLVKLERLKTMELGVLQDLRSHAGQTSPNRLLDPRSDVAPLIVQHLPQCRFKLLVDDFEPTVKGLDQIMANLEEDTFDPLNMNASAAGGDDDDLQSMLNDPELNAELQALELEEGD